MKNEVTVVQFNAYMQSDVLLMRYLYSSILSQVGRDCFLVEVLWVSPSDGECAESEAT